MRMFLAAAAAGAMSLTSGAMIAQAAQAQPYVEYRPVPVEPGYRYDAYGRVYYDDGYRYRAPAVGGAVLGPPLASAFAHVPFDQYGPDPNGMIAADGHRIKCKLTDDWDSRFDRYMTHRVCD